MLLCRDISGTKCDFSVQVQLRFCLSETSCPQEDHFPPNLCVKVNGKPCNLPVRVIIGSIIQSCSVFMHHGMLTSCVTVSHSRRSSALDLHTWTGTSLTDFSGCQIQNMTLYLFLCPSPKLILYIDFLATHCHFTVKSTEIAIKTWDACDLITYHFWDILAAQGFLPPTKNGVEPKRPSRPINITSLVRLSTTVPNTIVASWTSEIGRVSTIF